MTVSPAVLLCGQPSSRLSTHCPPRRPLYPSVGVCVRARAVGLDSRSILCTACMQTKRTPIYTCTQLRIIDCTMRCSECTHRLPRARCDRHSTAASEAASDAAAAQATASDADAATQWDAKLHSYVSLTITSAAGPAPTPVPITAHAHNL